MRRPGEEIDTKEVNRLLAIFFYAKFGWTIPSAIGRDPAVEAQCGQGMPRIMAIVLDVGTCLKMLTKTEQAAIYFRWNLLASRDSEDLEKTNLTIEASVAFRAGHLQHHDDLLDDAMNHHEAAGRYVHEARKQEKRKDYRRALVKLGIEMQSRDLFARALMGDRAGLAG